MWVLGKEPGKVLGLEPITRAIEPRIVLAITIRVWNLWYTKSNHSNNKSPTQTDSWQDEHLGLTLEASKRKCVSISKHKGQFTSDCSVLHKMYSSTKMRHRKRQEKSTHFEIQRNQQNQTQVWHRCWNHTTEDLVIMLTMCAPMEKCTAIKIRRVTSEESRASKTVGQYQMV